MMKRGRPHGHECESDEAKEARVVARETGYRVPRSGPEFESSEEVTGEERAAKNRDADPPA